MHDATPVQYEAENVNAASIQPPNNKPTLDLIRGILQLLNDQSRTGSSANFIDSVYETHHRHKSFRRVRPPVVRARRFGCVLLGCVHTHMGPKPSLV